MKVLAIDPGAACGWAVACDPDIIIASGVWDLATRRHESSGMKLIRLRGLLTTVIRSEKIGLVAYETAIMGKPGRTAAVVSGSELQAAIKMTCEELQVAYVGFAPPEVKRFATGKGNANKAAMLGAAAARWPGYTFVDDNEVDARWIALLALSVSNPTA